MHKHIQNKHYYAIKPFRRIPKIQFLLLILIILQFGKPVLATEHQPNVPSRAKKEISESYDSSADSFINRQTSAPTTKKEKEKMLQNYEREIRELKNTHKQLKADLKLTRKNSAQVAADTVEEYKGDEKKAEHKALEQEYADKTKKTKKIITELEMMKKNNTDLEKTNTIISWIIFGLCIALFITICLLYFKFKCCAEQTVKEIIPEVIADRPTRTSLQFMQQDEQKQLSVKKTIPSMCKIPKVTADRPTRTSLQFNMQDHEYWSRSTSTTPFGTETREIVQHHFQPSSSSDHPYASTKLPKPNDLRSHQNFRLTKSSQILSNNDL